MTAAACGALLTVVPAPAQTASQPPAGKGKVDQHDKEPSPPAPQDQEPQEPDVDEETKSSPAPPPGVPDWAFDARWYHVMVSRFANGSKENDPPNTRRWTEEWPKLNDLKTPEEKASLSARSYGGDLQGLQAKLPYLKGLGFNALSLTPVFAAGSDDKYHTTDLRHIDDSFGVEGSLAKLVGEQADPKTWKWSASDRVFLDFLKKAHETGFRVIIDGVFTSVGEDFWAWREVREFGRGSPLADWFAVTDFGPPRQWEGPDGPSGARVYFRRSKTGLAPLVENHIFAVTKRWMDPNGDGDPSDGVDGWRVDDADRVAGGLWQRWRGVVKRLNPEALIVGEVHPARDPSPWLQGDQLDSVLNYKAGGWIRTFFARDSGDYLPGKFMRDLEATREPFDLETNLAMLNLVDSHDTTRVFTRLSRPKPKRLPDKETGRENDKEPASKSDKAKDKEPKAEEDDSGLTEADLDRWRLAAAFKAFYIGAPVTYYGDEVGMTGERSPFSRAPMWWPAPGKPSQTPKGYRPDFLKLTRLLNTLRNVHEPLRRGGCKTLLADDDRRIIAFSRFLPGSEIIVVMNCSDKKHRVQLEAGKAGEMVGVLTPQLKPMPATGPQLRVSASRYPVNKAGRIDFAIDPMSVRLLIVRK